MGISGKHEHCATCNEPLQVCNGHFGHVKLCLPVFHVGYFKKVVSILQSICKVGLLNHNIYKIDKVRIVQVSFSLKTIDENSYETFETHV